MPQQGDKLCARGGCYNRRVLGSKYCEECNAKLEQSDYVVSKVAKDPFYNMMRWRNFSLRYRKEHPWCEECIKSERVVPSRHVDHIVPMAEGGAKLERSNVQALCVSCHSKKTRRDNA